jgi:hypothetical protein
MVPLPKGYRAHDIPVDYNGMLFLESQMREHGRAEIEACIKMLEEIHERRKHVDNLAMYFANLLRDRL